MDREYERQVTLLLELSRYLLWYLLEFFAVIASHSRRNKMTSSRIAKVLQPVILSPVKAGEYLIEEDIFSELSQDVLIFLIEFQMMDMAGVSVKPMDGTLTTTWR